VYCLGLIGGYQSRAREEAVGSSDDRKEIPLPDGRGSELRKIAAARYDSPMADRPFAQSQPCPQPILDLIGRFELHAETYRRQEYNETQVRREFIDPFFKALGWDVDNEAGHAEAYKDVIHEDAIKVGGSTKAPDYCFRIGGVRKFFVEAKKPSVSVGDDPGPAYQLRRYAWTNKLPLSIVTDFEEFAVYDCRIKPKPDDKPSTARVLYLKCDEYLKRWDEIASIFSKDAILKGSFDKYAESNKRKRGTTEVDDEFLKEIESWRDELARSIALRNPNLSVRDLNYAVGKTIDRIIFLRMCEDRGVEIYAQLRLLLNGPRVYPRLLDIFYMADQRYNSGLFHFEPEKNRPDPPDTLTPNLTIDDAVLKDIIKNLYYPQCPYEFSVMPPEILGQVYEQFLGKVITLTAGHRAKVEYKPEVKKAGGVYYTPKYIVDYIVEHTVGALLGDEGLGSGVWGLGKGTSNGDENLSRTGSVAKGDGPGGSGLPLDGGVSAGRTVRAGEPGSTRGRLSPRQHRRGIRAGSPEGIPPASVHRQGVTDGSGNAPDDRGAPGVPNAGTNASGVATGATSGADADQTQRRPEAPPNPNPQTLTPEDVSKLRILDPACGSGSFLLGAYQCLLDWHLRWYNEHEPEKWLKKKNPPIYETTGFGVWGFGYGGSGGSPTPTPRPPTPTYRLTITEKKRILLNNIYGVDIDPQAVEVTKLSLLLKVLEGESQQSLDNQLRLFHERALPDLGGNIKCGNSLIGPDFYENQQLDLLDDEERYRINVFDWQREFPEVFQSRDDIQSRARKEAESSHRARKEAVSSAANDKKPLPHGRGSDQYAPSGGFDAVIGNPPYIQLSMAEYFDERVNLYLQGRYTSAMGRLNTFGLFVERALRSVLTPKGFLSYIVPNTFLTQESYQDLRRQILTHQISSLVTFKYPVFKGAVVETVIFVVQRGAPTPQQCVDVVSFDNRAMSSTQRQIEQSLFGETHCNAFLVNVDQSTIAFRSKLDTKGVPLKQFVNINQAIALKHDRSASVFRERRASNYQRVLDGRHIHRYAVNWGGDYLAYDVKKIHSCRRTDIFDATEKLFFRRVGDRLIAAYDDQQFYALNTLVVITLREHVPMSLKYVLGLLNSRLLNFYYVTYLKSTKKVFSEIQARQLAQLPVREINLSESDDKSHHDRLVALVGRMLDLHKQLAAGKTPSDQTVIQRQIDATDRQIDLLVYELYGLTDDEIKIVEEATQR